MYQYVYTKEVLNKYVFISSREKSEKNPFFIFSMLTRKRLRDESVQKKSIGFHPILESVTRFLRFKDVGQISASNQFFYQKMWIYLLRSTSRELKLNESILFDGKSLSWTLKYATELKHQKLKVVSQHARFFTIFIPQIDKLSISNGEYATIRLPRKLQSLEIQGPIPTKLRLSGITNFTCGGNYHTDLENIPKFVKDLHIINSFIWFGCLGYLPNVKSLTLYCREVEDVDKLQTQCPLLETVTIQHYGNLPTQGIENIKVSTLILDFPNVSNMFDIYVHHVKTLDLSRCPKLFDYSNFKNIPHIIYPNK
jgi:hypothetical protein